MNEKRIGVYICHCGNNIAGTVDVTTVKEFASTLPSVIISRDYKFMCSDPGQDLIKRDIKECGLNGVVVASCTVMIHGPTFRRACSDGGLNPYLLEMANIREQCSWVHGDAIATGKAKSLVSAAVRKAYYHEPLAVKEVPVTPATLILGGGVAGIQAALEIANSGYRVYLVEREPFIGGHVIQLESTFPNLDRTLDIFRPKMEEVVSHSNIELLTGSEVEEISGHVGHFKVNIRKKARYVDGGRCTGCGVCQENCPSEAGSEFDLGLGKRKAIYTPFSQAIPNVPVIDEGHCVHFQDGACHACEESCETGAIDFGQEDQAIEIEVGNIIIATGYTLFDPLKIPQYGYGRYENVFTSLEFERMSSSFGPTGGKIQLRDGRTPESVAIIHCVGSRDENYQEYCSRICCMYALKFSHCLKERTGANVYQLYIDMRCFGKGHEEFYRRVSEEGVNFVRGKAAEVQKDDGDGKLKVVVMDTLLGRMVHISVDMVILCPSIVPQQDAARVSKMFNINRRADGFFRERHIKLDPIASPVDGIFISGCCQGPKDIPDSVAQALAAAARALAMISRGKITIDLNTCLVDEEVCAGCGQCISVCAYQAIELNDRKKVARVNEALCKGCGACAVTCPSKAMIHKNWLPGQFFEMIDVLTRAYA